MAVVWLREITGRDEEQDIEGNRRKRRTYQVITDTAQRTSIEVLAHPDIPTFGSFYQFLDESGGVPNLITDFAVVAIRRRAEQNDADNLCNWTAVVEYAGVDEPEAQPAEVEYSPTTYQENVLEDVNGDQVLNSAGDPYAEGVLKDRTRFTLQITKNIANANWNPTVAAGYQDTLNANPFMGFPAKTCKLKLAAKRVKKTGLNAFYWQRTAHIDVDLRTWTAKLRDAGYRQFDYTLGRAVPILDEHTHSPPSQPRLLDPDTGLVLEPEQEVPLPVEWEVYEAVDWTPLNLEY